MAETGYAPEGEKQGSQKENIGPQKPRNETFNPYSVLGVSRDIKTGDLKRAYRKLSRQYHPDVNADPAAAERFKDISHAYDILSDDRKRSDYDLKTQTDDQFKQSAWDDHGTDSSEQQPPSTEQWWKTFGPLDEFYFNTREKKTTKSGRNRIHQRHRTINWQKENAERKRIDHKADEEFKRDHEKIRRTYLSKDYGEYLSHFNQLQRDYDKKYHQKAKYGPFRIEADANVSQDLETAIIDKLIDDKHYSAEPKIYLLPDGSYLRIANYWNGNTEQREDTTRIEHITGDKDEGGYYHSKGIEIVHDKQNSELWLRRISRPYKTPNMSLPLQFFLNVGFGGPYSSVITEGTIKNKELKDYIGLLQEATPRYS